jgi:hypothetical protein
MADSADLRESSFQTDLCEDEKDLRDCSLSESR